MQPPSATASSDQTIPPAEPQATPTAEHPQYSRRPVPSRRRAKERGKWQSPDGRGAAYVPATAPGRRGSEKTAAHCRADTARADAIAVQRFPQGFTQAKTGSRVIMRASSAAWTHTPNTLPRRSNSSALRKAKRRDSSVKSQNPSSGGATGHANTGEPRRESSAATIAVFKPGTRHASGQSGTTEPKRPLKASIARNSAGFRAMMSKKNEVCIPVRPCQRYDD